MKFKLAGTTKIMPVHAQFAINGKVRLIALETFRSVRSGTIIHQVNKRQLVDAARPLCCRLTFDGQDRYKSELVHKIH